MLRATNVLRHVLQGPGRPPSAPRGKSNTQVRSLQCALATQCENRRTISYGNYGISIFLPHFLFPHPCMQHEPTQCSPASKPWAICLGPYLPWYHCGLSSFQRTHKTLPLIVSSQIFPRLASMRNEKDMINKLMIILCQLHPPWHKIVCRREE